MKKDIPKDKAIPIKEAARVYRDRLGYIHEIPPIAETAVPEKSHAELMAEVEALYKEKFPEAKQQQQPKPNINEIKRLSELLKDAKT